MFFVVGCFCGLVIIKKEIRFFLKGIKNYFLKSSQQKWQLWFGEELFSYLESAKKLIPENATYTMTESTWRLIPAPMAEVRYYLYPRKWEKEAEYILFYDKKKEHFQFKDGVKTVSPLYPIVWSKGGEIVSHVYSPKTFSFLYDFQNQKILRVKK